MFKVILFVTLFAGSLAHAQSAQPALAQKVRNLEIKVQQLERTVLNINQRLSEIEYGGGGLPPVDPTPSVTHSALLVDTGYSKTFLGTGNTRLQAEASARQACGQAVHASYCNGSVRYGQSTFGSRGFFCVVTDSGYGKTFSGEGLDEIQAEAKAKIACQESVHPSYCGNVKARCEAVQ